MIRELKTLIAVAQEGTFAAAGKRRGNSRYVSPPPVSPVRCSSTPAAAEGPP